MPGFGRMNGSLESLDVAKLADQDDIRVLPDRVFQRLMPVARVKADLTLVDVRFLVGKDVFDRVFNRENVEVFAFGNVVKHRGDGRAFTAAGDAGENNHSVGIMAQLFDAGGQAKIREAWDHVVDAPRH